MKKTLLATALGLTLLTSSLTAQADPKQFNEAWVRISKIQCLVEYFYMEAGFYPTTLDELEQLINSKAPKGVKPVGIPKDPATNQPFSYTLDKSGRRYILTVPDSTKYTEGKPLVTALEWGFLADLAEVRRYRQVVEHTTNILKAVATQVELYAKDHQGQFPAAMDDLMPKYLTRYPTDPLTNKNFEYQKLPAGYIIRCGNPERYGFKTFQYSSVSGMEIVPLTTAKAPARQSTPIEMSPTPTPKAP